MKQLTRSLPVVLIWLSTSLGSPAQESVYILTQKEFELGRSSMNFSPDGKALLAGFSDGSLRVLDPASLETSLEVTGAHQKAVVALDMPPKMDFIMSAGGNMIKVWNLSGKHIGNFSGHATTIWNVEMSRDGRRAVSSAFNKTFLLWDVYNGVIEKHMRGHNDVTRAVSIAPDNRTIASGSDDLSICIWDAGTGEVTHTLHGPTAAIYHLAFSPDNKYLAASSAENNIRIYDLEAMELHQLLAGHEKVVRKSVFSPCGHFLASISEDRSLKLWDLKRKELVHTFTGNESLLLDVDFHPSGESVYSVSRDGVLTRLDLNPEIFVLRYFKEEYLEALAGEPLLEPRQKGESRKDFQSRQTEADKRKGEITGRFYQRYLDEILGPDSVQ